MKVGTLIEQFRFDTMKPISYTYDVIRQTYAVKRKTVWTHFSNILHVKVNIWIAALWFSQQNIKKNQLQIETAQNDVICIKIVSQLEYTRINFVLNLRTN